MKKIRIQKSGTNSNLLSQKRSSLNQDSLAMSTKSELRGPSPNDTQNNRASKMFFQNMKTELSNIKNDFEKLIRKQINLKPHDPLKILNSNRQKPYSSAKKDQRSVSEFEKFDASNIKKDFEQPYSKILNLEKNLPCSFDQKQLISKTVQIRDKKPAEASFEGLQLNQSHYSDKEEIKALKQNIRALHDQLQKKTEICSNFSEEIKNISNQKLSLIIHTSDLNKELANKNQIILETEKDNQELSKTLKTLEEEKYNLSIERNQWAQERNYLNQQLGQLSFHHEELRIIHQQVLAENDHFREQLERMEKYCDDLQNRSTSLENDYKRKIDYLHRDLQSYSKREDMFTVQIEKLTLQIKSQNDLPQQQGENKDQNALTEEISNLKEQIVHLKRQISIEKELHQTLAKKYQNQAFETNSSTDILKSFQLKTSELVDQNGKLKTKINYLESNLESLNEQNKSYIQQIRLYEERDKKQSQRKQLSPSQWEEMTEEIEKLKEENIRLTESLEQKAFDKETIKQENPISEELLKLTHQQLKEIITLKETINELNIQNVRFGNQVEQLKNVNFRLKLTPNFQVSSLQQQLLIRSKREKALKDLIFSVIVKKISKREDQLDVQYIMRQIQSLRQSWE